MLFPVGTIQCLQSHVYCSMLCSSIILLEECLQHDILIYHLVGGMSSHVDSGMWCSSIEKWSGGCLDEVHFDLFSHEHCRYVSSCHHMFSWPTLLVCVFTYCMLPSWQLLVCVISLYVPITIHLPPICPFLYIYTLLYVWNMHLNARARYVCWCAMLDIPLRMNFTHDDVVVGR